MTPPQITVGLHLHREPQQSHNPRMVTYLSEPELEKLALNIEAHFQQFEPIAPLRVLGAGFRSVAVETASGMVVRVGRSEEASRGYALEQQVLSFLRQELGAQVPDFQGYMPPGPLFPHGMLAYRTLPGITPSPSETNPPQLAADLGAFLSNLHSLPVEETSSFGVPVIDSISRVLAAQPAVMPILAKLLGAAELEIVEKWWRQFEQDTNLGVGSFSVCHHDLWQENLLMNSDGRLSGVLDWAHTEISDRAHDFAAINHFGSQFTENVIRAYREVGGSFSDEERHRMDMFWAAREFGGLAWAVEHDQHNEIMDGVRKIKSGPLFQ